MAEVPCPIIVMNLCGKEADASRELGYAVDVLIASIAKRYAIRSGCIVDKGTVVCTELCNIGVSS